MLPAVTTGWKSSIKPDRNTNMKPSIDRMIFPEALPAWYWTSTTFASNTEMGWDVDFGSSNVDKIYKSLAENAHAVSQRLPDPVSL